MPAEHTAVLVAAVACAVSVVVLAVVIAVLGRRVRELHAAVDALEREALALVRETRVVADHAATEMQRVGDVLGSAEAVSATIDSASRLTYRAFSNPVVKVLAYSTGLTGALRRLFSPRPMPSGSGRVPSHAPGARRRGRTVPAQVQRRQPAAVRAPHADEALPLRANGTR